MLFNRAIMEEFVLQGLETGVTLIVEDGSIVENANTYVSLADCANYNIMMGNSAWTTYAQVDRETAILRAMRWLENFEARWQGYRTDRTQVLAWPRTGMVDLDGYDLDENYIPMAIKDALCEAAWQELQAKDVFNPGVGEGGEVLEKSVKAGPVEASYKYAQATKLAGAFPAIMDKLKPYLIETPQRRSRGA